MICVSLEEEIRLILLSVRQCQKHRKDNFSVYMSRGPTVEKSGRVFVQSMPREMSNQTTYFLFIVLTVEEIDL